MKNQELIKEFESALHKNFVEMSRLRRFPRLKSILNSKGYYKGAIDLIEGPDTTGLADLIMFKREDLSIERLALEERFRPLFTDKQIQLCEQKLRRRQD